MVRSLRARGDISRATRELGTWLERRPDSAALHVEKGWLSLAERAAPAAREAFTEALRLSPGSVEARQGLVAVLLAEGNLEEVRRKTDEWTGAGPANVEMQMLSARVALVGGRATDAERTLRAVIAAAPSRLDAYDLLGRMYVSQGQLDRALEEYKAIASRSPDAAGPSTMIAMILAAQGKHDEARQQYERVLQETPPCGCCCEQPGVDLCRDREGGGSGAPGGDSRRGTAGPSRGTGHAWLGVLPSGAARARAVSIRAGDRTRARQPRLSLPSRPRSLESGQQRAGPGGAPAGAATEG